MPWIAKAGSTSSRTPHPAHRSGGARTEGTACGPDAGSGATAATNTLSREPTRNRGRSITSRSSATRQGSSPAASVQTRAILVAGSIESSSWPGFQPVAGTARATMSARRPRTITEFQVATAGGKAASSRTTSGNSLNGPTTIRQAPGSVPRSTTAVAAAAPVTNGRVNSGSVRSSVVTSAGKSGTTTRCPRTAPERRTAAE